MKPPLHRAVSMIGAFFALAFTALAADPAITVSAKQRYPWNGLVDLHFTITGTSGTKYDTSFTAKDVVGGTNIAMRTIRKSKGVAANATKEQLLPGSYKWVWDAAADLPDGFVCDRMTITGTTEEQKPLYMVIDLSSGPDSSSYPVSYFDAVPTGGWSDEYKTTKLVLRRIEPGAFLMCNQYNVTLTKPFYIGVFECTQKQYSLVMGSNPSYWGRGDSRPVGWVQYFKLRGEDKGQYWPSSSEVDSDSFMGKMRARTGVEFDLPTEAQWEYACRAGTTSEYNNGGNSEDDLREVGRYSKNQSDGKGGYTSSYTTVGSYLPNAWGLYDMHGNVNEWCLDNPGDLSDNMIDPKGSSVIQNGPIGMRFRALRSGSYADGADKCTSGCRQFDAQQTLNTSYNDGFRLCLPLHQ